MQGILLPHQGTATCRRMHRRGDCTNGGQLNCWCQTRLLQFSTAWHHYLEHQQNPACHQHAGSSGHRHRKRDHITPVLEKLHWLPVQSRITFKVALIAYKTLLSKKPDYLSELLSFQAAPRTLRSSSSNRLHVDVLGLFSQVASFVLQHLKFRTVSQTT